MKKYGKVIIYDGFCGKIMDIDKIEYIFTYEDVIGEPIRIGDIVQFSFELYETIEYSQKIARYIKKNK